MLGRMPISLCRSCGYFSLKIIRNASGLLKAGYHLITSNCCIQCRAIGLLKTIQRNAVSPYADILLDHDLQDQIVTETDHLLSGTNVLQFIIRHMPPDVPIMVHSMNFRRADDLVKKLRGAGFEVTRVPFSVLNQNNLIEWLNDVRDIWEDR